jgi:hypothetical protein
MTTINDLARELKMQPHEVAGYGNFGPILGGDTYNTPLPVEDVQAVREAYAIDALNGLCDDPEVAHGMADDMLLMCVSPEVRAAFERARERCGGFRYR